MQQQPRSLLSPSSSSSGGGGSSDGSSSSPARPPGGYGPPRQVPKPPPLQTGPLNSTSTPQAQSLPVLRRGSYQSLKRQPSKGSDGGAADEAPSVIGMLKKATHWEVRRGTPAQAPHAGLQPMRAY